MPLYEYECGRCGKRTELIQRVGDPPPPACSECGGELRRLLSAPAFQFKGSGWYVTDYARKATSSEAESKGSSSAKSGGDSGEKSEKKEKKPDSGTKSEKAQAS